MMTLKDIAKLFNRALAYSFDLKKFLFLFLVLVFSGFICLFFQAIAVYVTSWLQIFLKYLPLFFVTALLLGAGVLLLKVYQHEREGEAPSFRKVMFDSWEVVIKASYWALPLFLAFLVFWITLGVFILLKAIPYLGFFLGIVLAFGPFLLDLGMIVLFLSALFLFYFATPIYAIDQRLDIKALIKRIRTDFFTHLFLFLVAFFPVWIIWKIVRGAAFLTLEIYSFEENQIMTILQLFFMMLPIVAIMAPVINFFFNFSLEAFLWREAYDTVPEENASDLE